MLVRYLACVRPIEVFLMNLNGAPAEKVAMQNRFLFADNGDVWPESRFSSEMMRVTRDYFGAKLMPGDWRHATAAIFREFKIR